ncbi:ankyrin repeat-containing domain protein [Podospora didyma]|uniref:Ankyrin repeat-containing domain protein n=1 Tax=Podospora didyma TaxID=330526 RepID=A0AAE0NQ63_9PEZI|nr:ankyrin repeat-containing domain protein [Podospora didyma]
MDPVTAISTIAGVVTVVVSTTNSLRQLISSIKDSSDVMRAIATELDGLADILELTKKLITARKLRKGDVYVIEVVQRSIKDCQKPMEKLLLIIEPLLQAPEEGVGSFRQKRIDLVRAMSWPTRWNEIKAQKRALESQKTNLLMIIHLVGDYMAGKSEDAIRRDFARRFAQEVRRPGTARGRRMRAKLEDDISTIVGSRLEHYDTDEDDDGGGDENHIENDDQTGTILPIHEPRNPALAFLKAITAGDTDTVSAFLKSGTNPSRRSPDGSTPLHLSARLDCRPTATLLLDHGVNINAKDGEGRTALDIAARGHCISVVSLLIERGSLLGTLPHDILTTVGIDGQWKPALQSLAARSSSLDQARLIHKAVEAFDLPALSLLLEAGFDVNSSDRGFYPIHHAVMQGNLPTVELLVQHGANVNQRVTSGALGVPRSDAIKELTSVRDCSYDSSPLSLTVDNLEVFEFLLAHGADPDLPLEPPNGTPCLNAICMNKFFPFAKAILEAGADPNRRDEAGRTPLWWCIDMYNIRLMRELIQHGADVNARLGDGVTLLHKAVWDNRFLEAELLLQSGANAAARDFTGHTPLQRAEKDGRACDELITLLRAHERSGGGGDSG